jgi:cell wall assembly regulator SMI1
MPVRVTDPDRDPQRLWRAYLDWLAEHAPAVAALLNPPAEESAIAELERLIGYELPEAVKVGWRLHDGQDCESNFGAALGFWWQPVAQVAKQWDDWRWIRENEEEVFFKDMDKPQRSSPAGAIQCRYTVPGWIPLLRWPWDGDYVGLDFEPGPAGVRGQVINFGRDQERKFVVADDFTTLLAWMVQEAQADRVAFGPTYPDYEPEDEDDVGDLDEDFTFGHLNGILVNALRFTVQPEF